MVRVDVNGITQTLFRHIFTNMGGRYPGAINLFIATSSISIPRGPRLDSASPSLTSSTSPTTTRRGRGACRLRHDQALGPKAPEVSSAGSRSSKRSPPMLRSSVPLRSLSTSTRAEPIQDLRSACGSATSRRRVSVRHQRAELEALGGTQDGHLPGLSTPR